MQQRLILLAISFALLLLGPAFASPKLENGRKERTYFTNRVVVTTKGSSQGEQSTAPGGILHIKNAVSTGYVETNPDSPISGSILTLLSGSANLNTMQGLFSGRFELINEMGTFDGFIVGSVSVANVYGRIIGFGTGNFEGCMIKGSFEGIAENYVVDLTLYGILIFKSYPIYFDPPSEIVGEQNVSSC